MRKVNSPGLSDREIGVYALITGFPFASVSPSGSDDLTTTQEARGSKEASSSFNLKTNLSCKHVSSRSRRRRLYSLGSIVIIRLDPLEFEVNKVCGVKRTRLLEFHSLYSRSRVIEVGIGTQAGGTCTNQVESQV